MTQEKAKQDFSEAGGYDVTYNHFIKGLYKNVNIARKEGVDTTTVDLAIDLIEHAKALDFHVLSESLTKPYNGKIIRDFDNPVSYSIDGLIGQPWADKPEQPLEKHESWNDGRRKTSSGIAYVTDQKNLPINPYFNYGIKDRGLIGRFGPNHAADCGALRIIKNKDGKPALHALGIIRADIKVPALCGGFIEFDEYAGIFPFTKDIVVRTQASEFFEEMISGSVELLPEYAKNVEKETQLMFEYRENMMQRALSDDEKKIIAAQISTHAKVQQVKKEDPFFLSTLRNEFRYAHEVFAGPVLSSGRNTNTSWMETQLSWFMLDEKKWEQINAKCRFNYDFKAGDDAQAVLWHEISPTLLDQSGGHAALFCSLTSSYLLNEKPEDENTFDAIKEQARELIAFIDKKVPAKGKFEAVLRP